MQDRWHDDRCFSNWKLLSGYKMLPNLNFQPIYTCSTLHCYKLLQKVQNSGESGPIFMKVCQIWVFVPEEDKTYSDGY